MRADYHTARTPHAWRTDTSRITTGRQDVTRATISVLMHDNGPRGTHFCTCGHLLGEHDAEGTCECSCSAYEFSGDVLRDCGHLPDDDPCDEWTSQCPRCDQRVWPAERTTRRLTYQHCGFTWISEREPRPPARGRRGKLPFRQVWDRDNWTCVKCGTHKNLTVDHKIPVSKGGTDDLDNLQTMCGTCNSSKGNRV